MRSFKLTAVKDGNPRMIHPLVRTPTLYLEKNIPGAKG